MQNAIRDAAIVEVQSRVLEACLMQAQLPDGMPLDVLVNDTLYHEKKRLEIDRKSPTWAEDLAFWDGIKNRLGRSSEGEVRDILKAVLGRFTGEIRGNFNPVLYGVATRVLPRALPVLLNAMSPKRLFQRGIPDVSETIRIQGNVAALGRVSELGTVILTPTHVSNLDSPVIGWAIYALGLPPFTYGAGLNLFTNPVMSLFMRNLGAYRVDRQKTAPLYKDVLKEYATVSLELGQPNLFFPAGTRVRSGRVEQKLKLGLLSSGLRAYINNLLAKKEKPNLYIVPCTLNYHLVLEAESLIEDYLQREGKARYIIFDDESTRARKILNFMQNLINLEARITVQVGDPIDPFGNHVDPESGHSIDRHGRTIDITRYVTDRQGVPVQVQIRNLPEKGRPPGFPMGNVGRYSIGAKVDHRQVKVGEPVTLSLTVSGEGHLQNVKLAPLGEIEGTRIYDPRIEDSVTKNDGKLGGQRTWEYLILPQKAGELEIPAAELNYFDPITER